MRDEVKPSKESILGAKVGTIASTIFGLKKQEKQQSLLQKQIKATTCRAL